MSKWQEYEIEPKVLAILRDVPDATKGHHLGRPFLTAYQIAIEFAQRHPVETTKLGYPIGGVGAGARYSLSNYLAQQLSNEIKNGRIPVEGGFLSNHHLENVFFKTADGQTIQSSLTDTGLTLSMFRLRKPDSNKP